MNLVLIETSGNQAYIFATNKLRENVGASELTARVGEEFVWDAVKAAGGQVPKGGQVPEKPRNPAAFPAISETNPVEVILAVSGKALLLVRDAALGRQIVRNVTLRALREAPGLEVRGAVSRDFDFDREALHPLIGEVHRQFEVVRSSLPGPAARFQRLPIIAECASSGLPAAKYDKSGRQPGMRSAVTVAKRDAAEDGLKRIRGLVGKGHRPPYAVDDIEELGCDWLGIVHADGNGLGQVFLTFDQAAQTNGNRDYIDKLRRFSLALEECTKKAFCRSLTVFRPRRQKTPIVPLILGGDDLTVICDGRQALQFSKKFIECFEEETAEHSAINSILKDGATSCAGVAIIKPHFPFYAGYQLAEELLKSAKKLKPRSAIDYHILYDASGSDLERIRRELTIGSARLVARPYAVRDDSAPSLRAWSVLERRIDAVRGRDDEGRRRLPNSMLHELREGLFLGRDAAEARLELVRNRYRPHIDPLLADDKRLFWPEGEQYVTGLLDAVDTAEFWEAES